MALVWARLNVVWLERAKLGKKTSDSLKNLCCVFQFFYNLNKNAAFQKINRKCIISVETRSKTGRAGFLVSYWLAAFSRCFHVTQPIKSSGYFYFGFFKLSPLPIKHWQKDLQQHCRHSYSACLHINYIFFIFWSTIFKYLYLLKIEDY